MAGRDVVVKDSDVSRMYLLGDQVFHPAWVMEGDIGGEAWMRCLSSLMVVESVGWILVLVVGTVIRTGTGMGVSSGMKGIDIHSCPGENCRLRKRRGVSGIIHLSHSGFCTIKSRQLKF
jgi:hypothetical protein